MRKQNKPRYNQDEITPRKGLLGFIHKMVMVLLWPLRKPYIAIPLFILMYLIPTFIGARPNEVHIWYYNKIKGFFTPVGKQIVNKSKELAQNAPFEIPSLSELKDKVMPKSDSDTSQANPKLEEYNKEQEIRRKTFDKAKQAQSPYSIDIMSQPDQPNAPKFETKPKATEATTPTDVEQSPSQSEPADTSIAKAKQRKLDLIYLETPQEIIGEAHVVSANEIIINGNDIFLFGIYVDPNSRNGNIGKDFLKDFIGEDPVKCIIEAYTKQGIATGMCYVRQISINHTMVNNGISQDVAL